MRAAAARNIVKAWLLVGGLAAVFAGVGWLLGGTRPATLFAACSLLAALGVYAVGDRVLLGMLGARPLALAASPVLYTTVERVAARLEVRAPRVALVDDGFPRAFVAGGPRGATLAVSTGILTALTADELEAVVAHELAHVRARDVLTQTFAVVLSLTLLELARIGGWFSRGLLAILAPVAAAFTHVLLSPKRELAADAAAARVANGHDLADALLRLDQAGDLVVFEGSPATEPLFTVSPFDPSDRISRMFVTHPPVDDRVARLRSSADPP
jgi:heat shock protein HtpX